MEGKGRSKKEKLRCRGIYGIWKEEEGDESEEEE